MTTFRDKTTSRQQDRKAETSEDAVSLYMRDVEQRERLTREEETAIVREMIRRRDEIADLLRAVLLKACDTLDIDAIEGRRKARHPRERQSAEPSDSPIETYVTELTKLRAQAAAHLGSRLRTAIAVLVDKTRLRNLEAKILSIAELARRELQAVAKAARASGASARARRLLTDITAGFGLSATDVDRVATAITERRNAIEEAKRRLIESNLRLVVYFARRAKWRGADMADLIQEGNIALMNAVDSFDPEYGIPFGTFATIGVRRAIHRFGANAADIVRVPDDVRLRRRKIHSAAHYLSDANGTAPSWDEIAEYLELSRREVAEAFGYLEDAISLDDGADEMAPLANVIADPNAVDAEEALAAFEGESLVRHEIRQLDKRSRRLIEARYDAGDRSAATLAEVGRDFGVTRERARQIESAALRALRTRRETPRRTHSGGSRRRTASAF